MDADATAGFTESLSLFFCFPFFIFLKSIRFFPLSAYVISSSSMSCKWRLVYRYLTDLFRFGTWLIDWLIDWLTNYLWTESSSHGKVILFISGLYESHSIRTRKFSANWCRQASYKMALCTFLRRPSSCLRRRVYFYVKASVSRQDCRKETHNKLKDWRSPCKKHNFIMLGIFRICLPNYDDFARTETDTAVLIGACKSGTALETEILW